MIATAVPLHEWFKEVSDAGDFGYRVRDFLDRFAENPSSEWIMREPGLLAPVLADEGLADAYLAAVAAWLANKHRLPVPAWARGASRALARPWFAASSHKLRMLLLQESPAEFRLRNLFVSANALSRA